MRDATRRKKKRTDIDVVHAPPSIRHSSHATTSIGPTTIDGQASVSMILDLNDGHGPIEISFPANQAALIGSDLIASASKGGLHVHTTRELGRLVGYILDAAALRVAGHSAPSSWLRDRATEMRMLECSAEDLLEEAADNVRRGKAGAND